MSYFDSLFFKKLGVYNDSLVARNDEVGVICMQIFLLLQKFNSD